MPLPTIVHGGQSYVLAALPAPMGFAAANFREYRAGYPVLPEGQWRECDYSVGQKVRNQRSKSSCTAHATVAALEVTRREAGYPDVALSATFPYALCNGGVDEGASVAAVVKAVADVGDCLEATCPWDMVLKNQVPERAFQEAADHRAQEVLVVHTFEEMCSALSLARACAFGILVGQNFVNPDRNGVVPLPDRVLGGHALAGLGLRKFQGAWQVLFLNSWDASYGDNGRAYVTRDHTVRMFDASCVVLPKESPQTGDDEPPPVPGFDPNAKSPAA